MEERHELKRQRFLTLKDFSKDEIIYMIDLVAVLKEKNGELVYVGDAS